MYRLFTMKALLLLSILIASQFSILAQEPQQNFESIMRSANEKFAEKDYISAKTYYEMALRLRENDATAKNRLDETVDLIQKQMELQGRFYQNLDEGDRLNREGKIEEALEFYNKALTIFPQDKYTLSQTTKINETLNANNQRQQEYQTAMQLGEQLLDSKKFEEALVQFSQAASIFPEEILPKDRIASTQVLLVKQKEKEQLFNDLKTEANNLILRRSYPDAIVKIEEALALFPDDAATLTQLSDIKTLATKADRYNEILTKADEAYEQKKLEESRTLYRQALEVWPEQTYAIDMVSRIDQFLNSDTYLKEVALKKFLADANTEYHEKRFEAALKTYGKVIEIDAEHVLASERITEITFIIAQAKAEQEKEIRFAELVTKGDIAMSQSDFAQAVNDYRDASGIKQDDAVLNLKLADAENKFGEQQLALEKGNQYTKLIEDADKSLLENKLDNAKAFYSQALEVDNTQSYPREQIEKINTLLAEAEKKQQAEAAYNEHLALAKQHFDSRSWDLAITEYNKALQLNPDAELPKQQITEVNRLKENEASELANNQAYQAFIEDGNSSLSQKKYEAAIQAFTNALNLRPDESFPKQKIAEIELLVNEEKVMAEKESNYASLIATADQQFSNENFESSRENYNKALALFSEREHPASRISEINTIVAGKAAAQELEARYAALINEADSDFNTNNYQSAQLRYTDAMAMKPSEQHPKIKLEEIKAIFSDLAKQEELNRNYSQKIELADQRFSNELLDEALAAYREATQLKPNESYPFDQISLIETKKQALAAAKELETRVNNLKAQGDNLLSNNQLDEASGVFDQILSIDPANIYAASKKAEISLAIEAAERENKSRYDAAIAEGDRLIGLKEYQMAIVSFKTALGFKANDTYAAQKIKQVEAILEERLLALKSEYNKFVNEADRSFNTGNYDKAIEAYLRAEGIKPDERYPREMIQKIAQIMEANKIRELNVSPVQIAANVSRRFDFEPVDVTERRSNYILIKAKNSGNSPFPLLVNFGSKSGRNGGFVLPIPENDTYNDFIVRIGSQYKWFSEDNIWIELLPENGSIEVTMIQISKGN
jgi:tetratricopeptide (TPR) repeat protein